MKITVSSEMHGGLSGTLVLSRDMCAGTVVAEGVRYVSTACPIVYI
jgi:hypothetical protein